jgi:type VI secretion system protein ImpH
MASQNRASGDPVACAAVEPAAHQRLGEMLAALERTPHAFDFFQVLRHLECAHPERARLGRAPRPSEEPLRLGQAAALDFSPSTIASFTPSARLAIHFLGLLGPNGPLPIHLTDYARDRSRNAGDQTLVRFLDIFHHRILSLFYRAWADCQPAVSFDRPAQDRFATYLGSLFGLGMGSLRERDEFPDRAKLFFAGRLAAQPRNREGLVAILGSFFGLPVKVEEFVGEWLPLPEQARWRLGRSAKAGMLGQSTVAGARTWQCQSKFRIVFGPLDESDFESLLPGSQKLRQLGSLVRNMVGDSMTWDVRLRLENQISRPMCLGRGSRLGWSAWLGQSSHGPRRQDVVLNPLRCMAERKRM